MKMPTSPSTVLLLSLGMMVAPVMSAAQVVARFSVEPSEPGTGVGSGFIGERFSFRAQVPDASCIRIDFDDGNPPETQSGGTAFFTHRYQTVGTFVPRMEAFRGAGCNNLSGALVAEALSISVRVTSPPALQAARPAPVVIAPPLRITPPPSPPPVVVVREAPRKRSEQWPPMRPLQLVPYAQPEAEAPSRLPWFFMAIALALWLTKDLVPAKSEKIAFDAVKDRGRTRIGGAASAEDALTLRVVQRRAPAYALSSQARVTGSARKK
ncbi:MAG: hypothetical protein HKM98_04615 [Gammaproteobacteria bacterium]|nr:hypothetical protein [Gammaproteobacteria bacterium]